MNLFRKKALSEKNVPVLDLPNRWEKLKTKADQVSVDPEEFVERVDTASQRVDHLLQVVEANGGGVFEIVFGLSGSGKTTFVNTLPKFFDNIKVFSIGPNCPLTEIKQIVEKKYVASDTSKRVFLIERRDNPSDEDLRTVRNMFADLLDFFRTQEGSILLLWTITDEEAGKQIAATAWQVGRDSLVDPETRGLYEFKGLEKPKFRQVAEDTSKNLTGDGLDGFGISSDDAEDLLMDCDTISDYYGKLVKKSREVQAQTWSVLKEKIHPKLWIVLPGDSREAINSTVSSLTQGTRSRIDVDLLREFIEDPNNDAQYVKEWKARQGSLAHIFRTLDVRLFTMPPNVAVSAVRCFGEKSLKQRLSTKSGSKSQGSGAMKKTRIYKEILKELERDTETFAERGTIAEATEDEYRRIQVQAGSSDKPLNKALGKLFEHALCDDAVSASISIEKKKLGDTGLQPDILIELSNSDVICIEPTWRSTGAQVVGELKSRQNTLTPGHIKLYVLDKALDYVKALGL